MATMILVVGGLFWLRARQRRRVADSTPVAAQPWSVRKSLGWAGAPAASASASPSGWQQRGWRIERSSSREPLLPVEVGRRYPRLPVELIRFLERIESCVNADENVWFSCRASAGMSSSS
jgi:hypothetical protein